jgi:hypothetical protein
MDAFRPCGAWTSPPLPSGMFENQSNQQALDSALLLDRRFDYLPHALYHSSFCHSTPGKSCLTDA